MATIGNGGSGDTAETAILGMEDTQAKVKLPTMALLLLAWSGYGNAGAVLTTGVELAGARGTGGPVPKPALLVLERSRCGHAGAVSTADAGPTGAEGPVPSEMLLAPAGIRYGYGRVGAVATAWMERNPVPPIMLLVLAWTGCGCGHTGAVSTAGVVLVVTGDPVPSAKPLVLA